MNNLNKKDNYSDLDTKDLETSEEKEKLSCNEKINKDEYNHQKIIDKISNEYGYGKEVWKIISVVFCFFICSGFSQNFFGIMLLGFKEAINLTDSQISLIGSNFFIGKIIGSLLVGLLTFFGDRKKIALLSTISLFIVNLINVIWLNFYFLAIIRIFTGALSIFIEVISLSTLCEYLPTKNRSLVLNLIWIICPFTNLILLLIMKYTMPNLEASGVKLTL